MTAARNCLVLLRPRMFMRASANINNRDRGDKKNTNVILKI